MIVRLPADLSRALVLTIDSRRRLGVERLGEAAVDGERLSDWRWHFGKDKANSHGFDFPRRALDLRDTNEGTLGVDGNSSNRMPGSRCQMHEMKRLAG